MRIHENWTKFFRLFHFCHLNQFSTTRPLVFSMKHLNRKTTIKDQQIFFSRTISLWKMMGSPWKSLMISKDVMSYCSLEGSWCFWKVFSCGKKFGHFLIEFFISSVCKDAGQSLNSNWWFLKVCRFGNCRDVLGNHRNLIFNTFFYPKNNSVKHNKI